jgi:hypothetical protein
VYMLIYCDVPTVIWNKVGLCDGEYHGDSCMLTKEL